MAGGKQPKQGLTYYPVNTVPVPRSIVWVRWPFDDDPDEFKERPALVRAIQLNKAHTVARIEVAFGTSRLKEAERPYDLILMNVTEMLEAGLPKATRFDLDRCLWLPWAKEVFVCRDGSKTPVSGHLIASACEQLDYVLEMRRRLAGR